MANIQKKFLTPSFAAYSAILCPFVAIYDLLFIILLFSSFP